MGMLHRMLCFVFFHRLEITKIVREEPRRVLLLRCSRCQHRFVMSDEHQAFLRYDHDPRMPRDLIRIYPQLTTADF